MLSRSTVPWKFNAASSTNLVTLTVGHLASKASHGTTVNVHAQEKRLPAVSAAIVSVASDELYAEVAHHQPQETAWEASLRGPVPYLQRK